MSGSLDEPDFCFCPLPPPPPSDEEPRSRDDAEADRRVDALALPLALFALGPDRAGLLFEAFPLFVALDFARPELRAEPLALEPLELPVDFFCLLDERGFVCAITPPWVFDRTALANRIPRSERPKRLRG
jgi:hypothetical protein